MDDLVEQPNANRSLTRDFSTAVGTLSAAEELATILLDDARRLGRNSQSSGEPMSCNDAKTVALAFACIMKLADTKEKFGLFPDVAARGENPNDRSPIGILGVIKQVMDRAVRLGVRDAIVPEGDVQELEQLITPVPIADPVPVRIIESDPDYS